jgi:hypothetical protein
VYLHSFAKRISVEELIIHLNKKGHHKYNCRLPMQWLYHAINSPQTSAFFLYSESKSKAIPVTGREDP